MCNSCVYKFDSDNRMKCLVCDGEWCWTCRTKIEKGTFSDYHFEFFNVFGCPGLRHTPNYFLVTLILKLLTACLFPLTLLFAPILAAMRNYPNADSNLYNDQALRFQKQMRNSVHYVVAYGLAMGGFCFLGLVVGVLVSVIFAPVGFVY